MFSPIASKSSPTLKSVDYSGERLINYFLRPVEQGVTGAVLLGRSGLISKHPLGKIDGMADMNGALMVASGGKLYKNGVEVGDINFGRCRIVSSGTACGMVVNNKYFYYDGETVAQYETGAVSAPKAIGFKDGYFIICGQAGDRFDAITVSAIYDGKTFDPIDLAFAESKPDAILAVQSNYADLWLIGEASVEVFYNSGSSAFPFERNPSGVLDVGCISGETVVRSEGSVFWVTDQYRVVSSQGLSYQVISTHEIEEALREDGVVNAIAFSDRTHKFYAISTPKATYCYDLTTGLWSERETNGGAWVADYSCEIGNSQYIGTAQGVSEIDENSYADDGVTFHCSATSTPIEFQSPTAISQINIKVASGQADIGRDAQIMLQTTKDGFNWGAEKWRKLGRIGEYSKTAKWHALGQFTRGQFRVSISDEVPRDIIGFTYG